MSCGFESELKAESQVADLSIYIQQFKYTLLYQLA
jgi:hypothetical protein